MSPAAALAGVGVAGVVWSIGPAGPAVLERRRGTRAKGGRRRSPAGELPLLLDLLAAATAGGMGGPLALRSAVEAIAGPLGDRLAPIAADAALGPGLGDRVAEIGRDVGLPDLVRVGGVLSRSGSLGTPIAEALRDLATEHRRTRRREAEARARRAPVRMLFPLVFLILPAFLLLTVAPLLIATLGSLS